MEQNQQGSCALSTALDYLKPLDAEWVQGGVVYI